MATTQQGLKTEVEEEVKSKPKLKREDKEEPDTVEIPEIIKVLSWNIHGGNLEMASTVTPSPRSSERPEIVPVRSRGRTPPARHALVSEVVKEIDPDVLLLQETKSRPLVKEIIEKLGKRKYVEIAPLEKEGARENSWQEAKVLFDANKFETIEDREELGFAVQTLDKTKTTYYIPLREKEEGKPREAGIGKVVKERVSWVCLRRKNGPNAGKTITFMSFHNYNSKKESHRGANVFCGLVRAMKNEIGFDVVAGVDFNCEEEDLDPTQPEELDPTQREELDPTQPEEFNTEQKWNGIYIPQYIMSLRRTIRNKKKIDYIVTTLGQDEVSVESIAGGAVSKLEGKLVKDSRGETHSYCSDDYDIVVDHDPLLCTFNLADTTQNVKLRDV